MSNSKATSSHFHINLCDNGFDAGVCTTVNNIVFLSDNSVVTGCFAY